MKKMIEKLYFGEYSPHEKIIPRTNEMQIVINKNIQFTENTVAILKEHDIEDADKLLDDFLDSWVDLQQLENIVAFQEGIKLGLSIGILLAE